MAERERGTRVGRDELKTHASCSSCSKNLLVQQELVYSKDGTGFSERQEPEDKREDSLNSVREEEIRRVETGTN